MHPRQRGMSLIDLLIGLAIGLLVSLAALGSLVHNRLAYGTVTESTRLQQDASTAMRVVGQQLRLASAPVLVNAPNGQVRVDRGIENDLSAGLSGTDGGTGDADTLSVAYHRDAVLDGRDCLGQSPAGPVIHSRFRVAARELQCLGSADRPTFQGLVTGVEDFQVWYGLRQADALQYLPASAVADWSQVVSVQVCLMLVGEHRIHNAAGTEVTTCREGVSAPRDGRLRQSFRQVFSLRHHGN